WLWPQPIGWGRVVASADWLGKGRSPVTQVAGHVLIGKLLKVEEDRTRWSRLSCLLQVDGLSVHGVLLQPQELSPQTGGLPPDCSKCCHGEYSFRGYQGPPGPPGPPGIPGNHGNNGNNGATGHEGAKGEKGDKGDLGPRGERGQHGPKGEKGYPGIPPELQIAFMASLATHFSNQNSGIIFSSVETNIGNFFDVMTGRFGAPVSGVYFFTFSMMKHEDVEEVYVYLMHNGNTVFSMYSYETKGKSDTSSNHAVLKLAKGDEVWLRMGNGALHGDHQRFSTFAGFLLFETK
uniref:C1q domain-containing protein n=1 Tax=Felis catus TaxID=9685 RepID=A0ABI7Y066_FELCA